jgi:DNA-binding transcriptional MocR family regulator
MSKILGPGLRVGWLRLPTAELRRRTSTTLGIETDGLPALLAEVVARWIDDDTARAVLAELSTAMRARAHLARDIVGPDLVTHGASLHAWLPSADARTLRERIEARGVRVGDVTGYVARGRPGAGVRLCLGAEDDQDRLEAALRLVAASR